MPKILSIIIPMYNAKPYIKKCLDSLILPEILMDKLDILVVNDGSSDGCEFIVNDYVDRHQRVIRLLNKENGGHGSTINYAVPFCKGIYFRVLDADDWFSTQNLISFINYLEQTEPIDLVLSPYQTFDIQSHKQELVQADVIHKILSMHELINNWSTYKQINSLHAITYRTDFYRQLSLQLPEKVYYDDAFYSTIPAYKAAKIAITTHPIYIYRLGDINQSVSATNRVKRIHQLETVIEAMINAYDCTVSESNELFFNHRLISTIADYLITACLRHPDRRVGRKLARSFMMGLHSRSYTLYRCSQSRFVLLYTLSLLGFQETFLTKCMTTLQKKQRKQCREIFNYCSRI